MPNTTPKSIRPDIYAIYVVIRGLLIKIWVWNGFPRLSTPLFMGLVADLKNN